MQILKRFTFPLIVLVLLQEPAGGQVSATLFDKGQTRLSLNAGYSSIDDRNYFILGAGAGYYVWRGLEAGLDGAAWMGAKPHIYEVSPRLTYVVTQWEQWKPYVGGFYRRTFYDTLPNLDSAGGRAGIISMLGERTTVSAGLVFENYFDCDKAIYDKCSQIYPELALGFTF